MKPDERAFLLALLAAHDLPDGEPSDVRAVVDGFEMPWKRKRYLLREKWVDRKGWWEYGVTWAGGWLTPDGIEAARNA